MSCAFPAPCFLPSPEISLSQSGLMRSLCSVPSVFLWFIIFCFYNKVESLSQTFLFPCVRDTSARLFQPWTKPHLTSTLKPSLKPRSDLWSCDLPKRPHNNAIWLRNKSAPCPALELLLMPKPDLWWPEPACVGTAGTSSSSTDWWQPPVCSLTFPLVQNQH